MEDKIAVIEDALTQMQYKDYVTPSVLYSRFIGFL